MVADPDFLTLKKVVQRAKALHQVNGLSRLRTALISGQIVAVAKKLTLYKSKYCFEFSNFSAPLINKSENLVNLERRAYYAEKSAEDIYILPLKTCRHVFVGISLNDTLFDSLLDLLDPIDFHIYPDRLVYYKSTYKSGEFKESRYQRNRVLTRFVAEDVWCRSSDVNIEFPYNDEFPSRKSPGRQQKWMPEKSFEYAAACWMDAGGPVKQADLIRAISEGYQRDFGDEPAKSTAENHAREFLELPRPVNSQAVKFIERAISELPDGADDRAVYAAIQKHYKKLQFRPSFTTLMKQIRDFRSALPDN
ncbi:hypothetical protein [Rhizobium leguminosarum]|uniref:hypothetical protein n=1 Tax=Rhizobium leguminosarum TaxID=384 RepID=UPI001030284E|nr:hypothetical protein [Rhizobium leguminosarum]NEI02399.1 hypothetical protein [Rhizobium leguminosarum]TAX36495.1 hypothetical protein ELI06_20260 [Rhizobium leguminosarum]